MKRNWTIFTGVFVALLLMSMVVYAQYSGPTHNISPQVIAAPTEAPTGVPALAIDQSGLGVFLNLTKDGGTPVANLTKGGTLTVGTTVDNGAIAEDLSITGALAVSAPTAVATATPAMVINSLGVSNLFEVRDAATPVFAVNNGGNWIASGVGTNNNQVVVSAPTAIATAQPAFSVDSLGVSRIFEVRDAATPVAAVNNGGNLWLGKGLLGTSANIACTHGAALPDFSGTLVGQITASGTPTPNDFTVGPAGTIVILIGPVSTDTCTLTKGAKLALGAATRVMGLNDTIMLVSNGTSWNEVAFVAGATS